MTITNKQALYIAIYLYKGITEKNYREISIQIADNAFIGFERKGSSRFHIYVRVNNRYDKTARGSILPIPCENYNLLTDEIKATIENSNALEGVELNMSKVPNPSMEVLHQIDPTTLTEDDLEQTDQEETNGFVIEDFDSGNNEPVDNPVQNSDYIPLEEVEKDSHNDSTVSTPVPETSESADDVSDNETYDSFDDFSEETSSNDEENDEENSSKMDHLDKENGSGSPVKSKSSSPLFTDAIAAKTAETTSSTLLREHRSDHAHSLEMIRDHSYINSIIKDGFDLTPNTEAMFKHLAAKNSEKATDIYINLVCHLVTEYNYDISAMSMETGVDQRDIMLAMMEKQFN